MHWFGYTEMDSLNLEARASVERLMDTMPFDCDELECIDALRASGGDYESAREELQWSFGHRQKIFMG